MGEFEKLSCVIIDDSCLDRQVLSDEIGLIPQLKEIGSFDSCLTAHDFIKKHQVDLLFIDIEMPEISGLSYLRKIGEQDFSVVVVSSFPEYAVEGFALRVFDYVLKPIDAVRLQACVNRLLEFRLLKAKAKAYDVMFDGGKLIFKEGYNQIHLQINDVVYLEAFGDYTKIVTAEKHYLTLSTLTSFLAFLPSSSFARVHRSFIVSLTKIKALQGKQIDMGIKIVPVGKTYAKSVRGLTFS